VAALNLVYTEELMLPLVLLTWTDDPDDRLARMRELLDESARRISIWSLTCS
jgi:hypothetical protein